ncbi:MAG: MFS transporter [Acidimicrobiia bacterium]|nr:MFS transporter [Acidimicrobiia bacterium]
MNDSKPTSVLSPELLPASVAIFTLVGLSAFNSLGVSAALPNLAADLGNLELLPWVITIYLLMAGVATVVSGALIDTVGLRTIFRVSVVAFVVGSLIGGLTTSMPLLIAARAVQGTGGGGIIAVGLAGVNLLFPKHLVGRAFAANSTVWGVMGVAGPALAAFLLSFASWHWIFFVNVPFGLISLAAGWKVMPGPAGARSERRLDLVGLAIVFVFNLLLLFAVNAFDRRSGLLFGAALVVGVLYMWHAKRHGEPVMKRRHLVDPPFGLLAWSISLLLAGGIAAESFFTLYVRGARGASQSLTGWAVVFFVVGWTIGSNASSRMLDRLAETTTMVAGFALNLGGLASVALLAWVDAPLPFVFAAMTMVGSGLGMATNAGLTLLQSVTAAEESGRATAAHQFYRNLGFTLGAATGGAVVLFVVAQRLGDVEAVRGLLAGSEVADVAGAAALADGFAAAVAIGLGFGLAGLIPLGLLRGVLSDARNVANRHRRHPRYVP